MPCSQRAILPAIFVGVAKVFVNLSNISRDLVAVTVTLSVGSAVSADACRPPAISRMETANIRTVFPDMTAMPPPAIMQAENVLRNRS